MIDILTFSYLSENWIAVFYTLNCVLPYHDQSKESKWLLVIHIGRLNPLHRVLMLCYVTGDTLGGDGRQKKTYW